MRGSNGTSIFTRREAAKSIFKKVVHGMTLLVNRLRRKSLGSRETWHGWHPTARSDTVVGRCALRLCQRVRQIDERSRYRSDPSKGSPLLRADCAPPAKGLINYAMQKMRLSEECCGKNLGGKTRCS